MGWPPLHAPLLTVRLMMESAVIAAAATGAPSPMLDENINWVRRVAGHISVQNRAAFIFSPRPRSDALTNALLPPFRSF